MKKGWLITFFVAFFCICALNFNNMAYAQINQSSSNTENETGFKNQTPVEVLDILHRVSKYSEASQQEIELTSNYYGVDESIFKDLETKGYDFLTSAKIVDLNTKYNIDLKTIEECIKQGKDLDSLYLQNETSTTSSPNSTESDNEYIQKITPPKELEESYEEYVNPQNGSYSFKQEDIVLPGRNGLDLVIAPRYNSANAEVLYRYYKDDDRDGGEWVEELAEPGDYRYGFRGRGWSLGLSYLVLGYDIYWDLVPKYLCLPDGQLYEVNLDNTVTGLKDYAFSDMKFSKLSNGIYSYELAYKDGKKEFFSSRGKLVAITDKYRNIISFCYEGPSGYLSQITDTMGRVIKFNYITTETGKEIKISVPGKGDITYVFEKVPEHKDDLKLVRKIDFLGRTTAFSYNYDTVYRYYYPNPDDNNGQLKSTNFYANLVKVTHPNQSYSLNVYEVFTHIAPAYEDFYDGKFTSDKYRILSNEIVDGGISYNKCLYTYYGNYMSPYDYKEIQSPSGNTYFGHTTTVDNGNTKITSNYHDEYIQTLNEEGIGRWWINNPDKSKMSSEKVEELVYDNNNKLLMQKAFSYYKKELPTNITTTKYGTSLSNKITSSVSHVYDDYKDLLEYTNELGNKTTYTYETQYHRKTSETNSSSSYERTEWNYDSSSETMTVYYKEYDDLNSSSIKTYQVRRNYDAYGNVISEVINNGANKYYTYQNNNYLSSISTVT